MVEFAMNQQRKLSRHNSRQSSIGETTSVGSTKSGKSNGSSDYYSPTNSQRTSATTPTNTTNNNNNNGKKPNGISRHGSQESSGDSSGGGCPPQPANVLNVAEMLLHGVADNEILDIWLRSIDCKEFVAKFIDSGYDMPTISRITPQDLTAIGVTEPQKRLKILTEIKKLNLQDGIPNFVPASLSHWLSLIRLDSYYYKSLCDQQIDTIDKLCQLTWEDFEELGITKLGHQKRFQLAIERVRELEDHSKSSKKPLSEPIYDTNPSQILLVASSENHSMNGPIINKQSSTSELSSTGSGSMHSVYSAASTQYQPTYAPLPDNQQQQQSTIIVNQLQNGTQMMANHHLHQQQQQTPLHQPQQPHNQLNQSHQLPPPMFSQPPLPPSAQPLIYQHQQQQFNPLMGHIGGPSAAVQQQSHYQSIQPAQQMAMKFNCSTNDVVNPNNYNNGALENVSIQQQNRQSMSQLPFSALAKLPKHQQQLLQQSSIYATLRRQPSKAKQPPPPVPIRTNSLKSNSLTDHTHKQQQQQQLQQQQQQVAAQQQLMQNQQQYRNNYQSQNLMNNCHTTSTSSIYSTGTLVSAHCNATTGKDDDFPPPPSPLSVSGSDEHDLVSINSDGNFTDVGHNGMMTFRVGI